MYFSLVRHLLCLSTRISLRNPFESSGSYQEEMGAKSEEPAPVDTPVASSASRDASANRDEDTDQRAGNSGDEDVNTPEGAPLPEGAGQNVKGPDPKTDADAKSAHGDDDDAKSTESRYPPYRPGPRNIAPTPRRRNETAADYLLVLPLLVTSDGMRCNESPLPKLWTRQLINSAQEEDMGPQRRTSVHAGLEKVAVAQRGLATANSTGVLLPEAGGRWRDIQRQLSERSLHVLTRDTRRYRYIEKLAEDCNQLGVSVS
jgi:hypothetical protein